MKKDVNVIIRSFLLFFLKCMLPAFVVGLIYLDIKTFGNISEESFVEFGQETFLLGTSIVFMYLANKKKANGLWLVAGFFMCMFIRELDAYFDDIFHGSWKYVALVSAVFFTYKAWRSGKENAVNSLAVYMQSPAFTTMSFGMMVVLVFSRAMGMGKLWKLIMGENFNRVVKNVVEEGTELFGYSIIFLAAVEYACYLLSKKED
ncbi:MAG: transporter [Phascolarctobacterium sp.]|nr:transporter [Phascolarctobacterium sp.]